MTIITAVCTSCHSDRAITSSNIKAIEAAVAKALADGVLGGDLGGSHGTVAIGDAVLERL